MHQEVKNVYGRTFYKIEYNKSLDIVEAVWHGSATQQDLKNAVIAGLGIHEQTHCAYRLNDNTNFSGPWADSVTWLEEEWLPRAYLSRIRYLAHVARPSSFGELAGEAMLKGKIGSQIEVALFSDKAMAIDWLNAKRETQVLIH